MAASNQTMLFEERTSALDERMDCVRQMIAKLSEHRGPAQSQQGMVADVREELKQIGLNFERLRAEAERQGPKLQSALGERQKAIDDIKARFKRAIVKMERNRQLQAKSDREMLLVGAVSASELRKWRASTNENVANASHEVTNTLRETVRMMGTELEKSHANITSLKESSRMLSETKSRHEVLDSVMHLSHRLIAKLESADWVDRVLMLLAFVLFVGVVLTILVRRIWIPGLGLAFGFMRSLLFGGTPKVTGSALATTTSAAAAMSSITAITTVDAQPAGTAVAEPTAAASVATALNIDNLVTLALASSHTMTTAGFTDDSTVEGASIDEDATLREEYTGSGQEADSSIAAKPTERTHQPKNTKPPHSRKDIAPRRRKGARTRRDEL